MIRNGQEREQKAHGRPCRLRKKQDFSVNEMRALWKVLCEEWHHLIHRFRESSGCHEGHRPGGGALARSAFREPCGEKNYYKIVL